MDSMYRGYISKVRPEGLYVIVPKLGRTIEYGPCQRITTGQTPDPYVQDVQVLLSTFDGRPDDFVVLGVLVG